MKSVEREKYLYFSRPFDYLLGNHLIIKKQNLNRFQKYINSSGSIDLEKMIKDQVLSIGVIAGRFYGEKNDLFIKNDQYAKSLDMNFALEGQEMNLRKLVNNRVDSTIEYPEVTEFLKQKLKLPLDYISLPISGLPEYNMLRFSFPRNEWGLKMIREVNALIEPYIHTKEFEDLSFKWTPTKKKYLPEFRKLVDE